MKIIGICGENCEYCPRYIATQKGTLTDLEKVKELWGRIGLRDIDFPAEKMVCYGCGPENKCAFPELRDCVTKKHIETCGSCDEYPCNIINKVFGKSEKLKIHASKVCTEKEMKMLNKALFSKKMNIDSANRICKNSK
jgi:hypothetical protein